MLVLKGLGHLSACFASKPEGETNLKKRTGRYPIERDTGTSPPTQPLSVFNIPHAALPRMFLVARYFSILSPGPLLRVSPGVGTSSASSAFRVSSRHTQEAGHEPRRLRALPEVCNSDDAQPSAGRAPQLWRHLEIKNAALMAPLQKNNAVGVQWCHVLFFCFGKMVFCC